MYKGVIVVVGACLLQVAQCVDSKEAITSSLEVAQSLSAVLESGNFGSTMSKLATAAGPYLGVVGPALGLIMAFTGNQKDPQIEYMKYMLSRIENRFDKVDEQFNEVKKLIDWSKVQIQLSTHENTIRILSGVLDELYKANKNSQNGHRDEFIRLYESMWQVDTQIIYDYIVGSGVFYTNILEAAKKYTDNHRRKVQNFMLGLTDLILRGNTVELSYLELTNKTALRKDREKYWKSKIASMRSAMKKVDRDLERGYKSQMKKDVDKLLIKYKGRSHTYFATDVYNFLMEKFDWRDWLVVSYNELHGGSKHWVLVCGGYIKFRNNGRNTLIASVSRKSTPLLKKSKSAAEKLINDLKITKTIKTGLFKLGRATAIRGADEIFKQVPSKTIRCYRPYASFGVIRTGSGTVYKAPPNRLLRKEKKYKRYRTKYDVHLFG